MTDSMDDVRAAVALDGHERGDCDSPMCSYCEAEAETVAGDSTPGPWEYESGCVYARDGSRLAMMDRDERGTRPVERDSNARLMSAAPELLAAARAAVSDLTYSGGGRALPGYQRTVERLRAAIVTAETPTEGR